MKKAERHAIEARRVGRRIGWNEAGEAGEKKRRNTKEERPRSKRVGRPKDWKNASRARSGRTRVELELVNEYTSTRRIGNDRVNERVNERKKLRASG